LVESTVGAHLVNTAGPGVEVLWWRDRQDEVDFILRKGTRVVPIEVKSNRPGGTANALERFSRMFGTQPGIVVGPGGVDLETFLRSPAVAWC
jgi:predicted AAA+ superfamily ATPase